MLIIEADKEKEITNVQFKGKTHDIYKELLNAVVTTLDQMELEQGSREIPLSESLTTFGQHLITLAMSSGKELDEVSAFRKKAMRKIKEAFGGDE